MHVKPYTHKTRRLLLRPLRDTDAPQIATLAGDWDVARMTDRIPYPYTSAAAMEWIHGLPEGEHVFAIEREGTLIGLCGVMSRAPGEAEIGYWLGKPWWGKGFATEAAAQVMRYCFKDLKLTRLTCCHYVDNPASARVIKKLGFEQTGTTCEAWSEARRQKCAALRYQMKRPRFLFLWHPERRGKAA